MEGTISRAREDAGLKEERLLVFVRVGNSPDQYAVIVLAAHSYVGQGPEVAPWSKRTPSAPPAPLLGGDFWHFYWIKCPFPGRPCSVQGRRVSDGIPWSSNN
jgi:hypothetical protein